MALNDVVYNKTVDVAQSMPVPVVFAKQNENGKRKVIVTLLKDGQPFVIGTGISGYIQGATAPNPVTKQPIRFKRNLTSLDTTANTATFVITESMTAEIGITQCEVALYDTAKPNETICTANINIEVQGTGMSLNDEIASDDYQAIVSIKTEVTAMRDEVRDKTSQAITAQSAAETAAQNAYNSALNVQKIVAGNEAYTKQEADLKYSVAPRKAQSTTTGEMQLTNTDDGLAYLSLEGNSEQYTNTASTNMFDVEYNKSLGLDTTDKFLRPNGTIGDSIGWSYSYYIKVNPSTVYSFEGVPESRLAAFVFYTKDKAYISGIAINDAVIEGTRAVTTPDNCEWMRISYKYGTANKGMYLGQPPSQWVAGAIDTPSPEYPSEIKSVGDIPKDSNGVEIRNMLDDDYLKNPDHWSIEGSAVYYVKLSPNTAKLVGAAYKMLDIRSDWKSPLYISEETLAGANERIILINKNGVAGTGSYTFPSTDQIYLVGYNRNNDTMTKEQFIDEIFRCYKFMVTEAAEIDEYRPYIGENNGLVKIESIGLNHVDPKQVLTTRYSEVKVNEDNSVIKATQTIIEGGSSSYIYFNYEKDRQYTLYCKAKFIELSGTGGRSFVGIRDKTGIKSAIIQQGINTNNVINEVLLNFTATEDGLGVILYIQLDVNTSRRELYVYDLMIIEGEKTLQEMKALKYQPYHKQITWIPLREPLRKITGSGTYQDSIDQDGFVTQCILKCVLNGSIGNIYGGQTKEDLIGLSVNVESLLIASRRAVWCNKLAYLNSPSNASIEGCAEANTTLTIIVKKARLESADLAGFKKWLSDQYSKGEPVIAYPATVTPIAYQIPAVYIETYDQETNVRCLNKVKPSDMTLDYKIAMSSLIKRLEALEEKTVQEV